ncbi:MAG: 16S rRNA (guanine(527)-N(7))-methyltransferase RsmG [Acidobacteria bacterium]|nr:16S rRNA (guanine(527)-N(7))-methyltransferase RsmG [Acidobacteriota bacterium]
MNSSFEEILAAARKASGDHYSSVEINRLSIYYRLVMKWNERLHLTTLTSPEIFYQRHIMESEMASGLIRIATRTLWDLGSGLGIPGLPIAVLRPETEISLVESSRAKAVFLEEAIITLGLKNAAVIHDRIENLKRAPESSCLTARAIEKMERLIPQIFRLGSACSQLLIYGTEGIKPALVRSAGGNLELKEHPIPGSEKRFIFEINVPRGTV